MILDPIVIDPPNFDADAQWEEHKKAIDNITDEHGNLNHRAIHFADPGVVSCPSCHEHFWNLGLRQRCSKCSFEFPTDWWPMYSWGAQDGWRKRPRNPDYVRHEYYSYGYDNPVERPQDVAFKMDFKGLLVKAGEQLFRGHQVHFDKDGECRFSDTGQRTAETWKERPCGHCGLMQTAEGHDPCLGTLPGVINACCGHGNRSESFVMFEGGATLRGFLLDTQAPTEAQTDKP